MIDRLVGQLQLSLDKAVACAAFASKFPKTTGLIRSQRSNHIFREEFCSANERGC